MITGSKELAALPPRLLTGPETKVGMDRDKVDLSKSFSVCRVDVLPVNFFQERGKFARLALRRILDRSFPVAGNESGEEA